MADETTNANVVLTADVSGYQQNLTKAQQDTERLGAAVDTLSGKLSNLSKTVSTGVKVLGGTTLVGLAAATKQAADFEKQMSVLRATAATTGPAINRLEANVSSLARQFPIARGETVALITQLSNLGVKGTSQINTISQSMIKLSGATGESLGGLTQGFVELTRAMGNVSSGNMGKYANALYTVSRNAGVSATSVLSFAQAIAPMARASGIGQRELLGIATAFSKAGADGFAGASTMNSMMADITRNIQYGSPAIRKYSDLIGVTAEQFKKMDRAEAMTRLFEAIGSKGPEAIKILDQMGFDGIRAARAITAVSQTSGGLRKAIQDAQQGYAGKDLNKGAEAAFSGLDDAMARTKNNLQDIGIVIGQGLLTPLTMVASTAEKITGVFAGMVSAVKPLASILAPIAAAISGLMTGGMAPLAMLAGMQFLRGSATRAALSGGLADGRGSVKLGSYAATGQRMYHQGQFNPLQRGLYNVAGGLGQLMGPMREGGGPGGLSRLAGLGPRIGAWWNNTQTSFNLDSMRSPENRTRIFSPGFWGKFEDAGSALKGAWGGDTSVARTMMKDSATSLVHSFKALGNSVGDVNTRAIGFGESLRLLGRSVVNLSASTALAGSSAIARFSGRAMGIGASAMMGLAGNPWIASMVAGTSMYGMFRKSAENSASLNEGANVTVGLNAYNEKLGIATTGLGAFTEALGRAEASLPKATTTEDALKMTAAEANAAVAPKRKLTDDTVKSLSTPHEAVQYLKSLGKDVSPAALQAAAMDVKSRFPAKYDQIIKEYQESKDFGYHSSDLLGMAQRAQDNNYNLLGKSWNLGKNFLGMTNTMSEGAQNTVSAMVQGIMRKATVKEDHMTTESMQQRALPEVAKLLTTLFSKPSYRGGYSLEVKRQVLGELSNQLGFQIAIPDAQLDRKMTGEQALNQYMPAAAKSNLTQNGIILPSVDSQDAAQYEAKAAANAAKLANPVNDTVLQAIQRYGKGSQVDALISARDTVGTYGSKTSDPSAVQEWTTALASSTQNLVKNGQSYAQVNDALANLATRTKYSDEAFANVVQAARGLVAAFQSVSQAGLNSANTRNLRMKEADYKISSNDSEERRKGIEEKLNISNEAAGAIKGFILAGRNYKTSVARLNDAYDYSRQQTFNAFELQYGTGALKDIGGYSTRKTPYEGRSKRDYDIQVGIANREQQRSQTQSNASFERQYGTGMLNRMLEGTGQKQKTGGEKLSGYAQDDFNLSRKRQAEDFAKQMEYANADYLLQVKNANRDFDKSELRAKEDYQTSLSRMDRDFKKGQARAQADFDKSQSRAQADFDKQMIRRAQDAAKAMYDPFKRVTTQQTMDTQNLLINLRKQTKLIADQSKNLDALKKAGVSQETIDTLNLADSSQAQQLARMVSDLDKNPNLVTDLNSQVSARVSATSTLVNSTDNVDYRRAKEDFATSMERSREDFATQTKRSTDDYNQSLLDMGSDFEKSLKRARDDFDTSMKDMVTAFATSTERATAANQLSLDRQTEDFIRNSERTLAEYIFSTNYTLESFKLSMADMKNAYDKSVTDAKESQKIALTQMEYANSLTLLNMKKDFINAYTEVNGTAEELSKKALNLIETMGISKANAVVASVNSMVTAWKAGMDYINNPSGNPTGATRTQGNNSYTWDGKNWVPTSTYNAKGGYEADNGNGPTGNGTKGWTGQWKTYDNGSFHGGADFGVASGTPVYATRAMTVLAVENLGDESYGKYVKLTDGQHDFFYAHLSSQSVKAGQKLSEGALIGYSGNTGNSTGPHLHYEVRPHGAGHEFAVNPIDYMAVGGIVAGGAKRAILGEAGPEAVIPLNSKGAAFMASTIKEALTANYATPARAYHGGGETRMDYSSNFTGDIHVSANDPSQLARTLEAKARLQRLTRSTR